MKLVVSDSNSIINRAFYGVKIPPPKRRHLHQCRRRLPEHPAQLLADVQPDAVVCAFDLKAPTFRQRCSTATKRSARECPRSLPSSCRWSNSCSKAWATPSSPARAMKRTTSSAPCLLCANKAAIHALLPPATATACSSSAKNTVVLLAAPAWVKNETLLCDEDYFFQKYGTPRSGWWTSRL